MINIKKPSFVFMLFSAFLAASSAYAETVTPDERVKNTTNQVLEILRVNQDVQWGHPETGGEKQGLA